ncbi:hypothetical protein LSTR_LSTR010244 [Laodelphax striatellus]|uniref:DUF4485 domain-containing protein n=1 Tax=Laodelphax striatellus TaxID=195883 RepID=A0A482WLS3_LAOST|nr:hypothetical protein LSTR_LSTR010244 [Laodelphax striatellus]
MSKSDKSEEEAEPEVAEEAPFPMRGSLVQEQTGEPCELNIYDYEHLNALNTEFIYYSTTLKAVAPTMSSVSMRAKLVPWIKKLFGPEYQACFFQDKRNKYLLYMTLRILTDDISGVFDNDPPCGALAPIEELVGEKKGPAKWENDTTWERLLEGLPPERAMMGCSIHDEDCNSVQDTENVLPSALLDLEFRYFLHLARPYAALLMIPEDKAKVAVWMQTLATIRSTACLGMKGIRNDYMQTLLGYILDLRATGPFQEFPPPGSLQPLQEAAKYYAQKHPFTDPSSREANDFLISQPTPENGAMCYVAVSGDMVETNLVSTKPED